MTTNPTVNANTTSASVSASAFVPSRAEEHLCLRMRNLSTGIIEIVVVDGKPKYIIVKPKAEEI